MSSRFCWKCVVVFFGGESPISRQITEKDEIKIHELIWCFQKFTYVFFDLFDSENLRKLFAIFDGLHIVQRGREKPTN